MIDSMNTLLYENRDGIGLVTLNRGTANALNTEMLKEITTLFLQLRGDQTVKGVIITGKGNFFSAGLDVVELVGYDEPESKVFWTAFSHMMATLADFPKPLATAINGHSPAGGCIIAITADFRVMAEGDQFKIGLNEVPVGIVVPMPVYKLYSMWVGTRHAYQFLLQGKLLNPTEAYRAGLVDVLVPQDQVLATTENMMREMLQLDPITFSTTKANLRADIVHLLKGDFDATFGDTFRHWWDPAARERLLALVARLKKK